MNTKKTNTNAQKTNTIIPTKIQTKIRKTKKYNKKSQSQKHN